MLHRLLPDAPAVPWRIVVLILLAKAAWDTAGLLLGDAAFNDPAYDVLRTIPPLGGMRSRGVVFACLTAGTVLSAHHATRTSHTRPLRLCLTGMAVWYAAWASGLVASWLLHHRILGWSAPASVVVVAALALVAARATPARYSGGG